MRSLGPFAHSIRRRLTVLVAIVMLAVACQSTKTVGSNTTATPLTPATAILAAAEPESAPIQEVEAPEVEANPNYSHRIGLQHDITTDNYVAVLCRDALVVNGRVMGGTHPLLYGIAMPGVNVIPDLAEPFEPPDPKPAGEVWEVHVPLRRDAVWSDGHTITAHDVAFTFNLMRELGLFCRSYYGVVEEDSTRVGVLAVEAIEDRTVRITFNDEPGLPIWPHSIGVAPIVAAHFWTPHLTAAREAAESAVDAIANPAEEIWRAQQEEADSAGEEYLRKVDEISAAEIEDHLARVYRTTLVDELLGMSGAGEPSGGPVVLEEWKPGLSIRAAPHPQYHLSGESIRSGDVTYTVGPFIDELTFLVYDSQRSAAAALADGAIDIVEVPNPSPAIRTLLDTLPKVDIAENPIAGFRYLGFNLRKPPMNDLAFRRALAIMIDREYVATELLQGEVQPAWTLLPEANLQWFNDAAAAELSATYRNLDRFERLEAAVAALKEAGYTWEQEPEVSRSASGDRLIRAGSGIRLPNGTLQSELEIITPGPGSAMYSNATYAVFIEHWLEELGFRARVDVTTFGSVVGRVWPGVGVEPTYDMYLLGWTLDSAMPTLHGSIFHSNELAELNDGNNSVGYVNPELDELAERLLQVQTDEEARQIAWALEEIIARDLPYVVLHTLARTEAFRTRVEFPFTDSISGLLDYGLMPGLVRIRNEP